MEELKITFCKHEIEKLVKILNSFDEENVDFELGFETSVLTTSISKGIEEYIKRNNLWDIHIGLIRNDTYRITSCSECVKMHYEAFGDNYKLTISHIIQRYYEGDYGDMYTSFFDKQGDYGKDKANGTLKGGYETVYGKICISMNTLGLTHICHYFEMQLVVSNNASIHQVSYLI